MHRTVRHELDAIVVNYLVVKSNGMPFRMKSFGRGGGDRKQQRQGFQGLTRNAAERQVIEK
jgi:hypothetical protein